MPGLSQRRTRETRSEDLPRVSQLDNRGWGPDLGLDVTVITLRRASCHERPGTEGWFDCGVRCFHSLTRAEHLRSASFPWKTGEGSGFSMLEVLLQPSALLRASSALCAHVQSTPFYMFLHMLGKCSMTIATPPVPLPAFSWNLL